jgi:hypothetical protein
MPGTVTGEDARVMIGTHAAGVAPSVVTAGLKSYVLYGMGDFSVTMDRGTIEQDLIGQPGNYKDQGSLSLDGSMTLSKFAASKNSDALNSILDGTGTNKYFVVSANVGSTNPMKFYFISCQVTGYDVSIGDANTVTEAAIDFIVLNPQDIKHAGGLTYG